MRQKPNIQRLYELIQARGKVSSIDIAVWGVNNFYTSAPRHSRELVTDPVKIKKYPHIVRREPYSWEMNGHKRPFVVFEYRPEKQGRLW